MTKHILSIDGGGIRGILPLALRGGGRGVGLAPRFGHALRHRSWPQRKYRLRRCFTGERRRAGGAGQAIRDGGNQ